MNTEGYLEGDARWGKRGTSGEGCKGITRFVEVSGVVPVQWTSVFLGQDLRSRHLQSPSSDHCAFS